MLNRGVTPVVCQKGSVGACGDLAPMSQVALLLMGEGEAWYHGERLPGRAAMERAGIPVPGLQARDGLATINGSNLLTAMSAIQLHDIDRWLRQAEIACAMTLEALIANLKPYDARLHRAARLPRRGPQRGRDPALHRGERPADREGEDEGPGRLLDALHAAGHRRRPRRRRLGAGAGRDRAERRRRQPDLPAGGPRSPSPAPTSRERRSRSRWTWSARPSRWSASCPSGASTG